MKKILIAVALMFAAPTQAHAEVLNEKMCVLMGDYAGSVMQIRQIGHTKAQVLKLITTTNTIAYQLMLSVVELAYSLPLNTPHTVVDDLTTDKCLEVLNDTRNPIGA